MAARDADGTPRGASTPGIDLDRRRALKLLGGATVGVGAARAVDNVFVGYGHLTGTNLLDQSLGPLAREHLRPSGFALGWSEHELAYDGEWVRIRDGAGERVDAVRIAAVGPERAAALDEAYDLAGGPLAELAADLDAVEEDAFAFEFAGYRAFFDRLRAAETRPVTVAALRGTGFRRPALETVRQFTDSDPAAPEPLVAGLAAGFRGHTRYDVPRYVARSIQQHVLFGAANLDEHFRSPTDFEAILDGRTAGMLCWDLTFRSIEAFHAVAPHRQTPPVFGAIVTDARHGHVYTGLASVVREAGELVVPMTFLDYTHSTLSDQLALRRVLGEGVDAYDEHHRASGISWNR